MPSEVFDRAFLGFDPGGTGAFGVAWLRCGLVEVKTVDTVKDALEWAQEKCDRELPFAAGIDTLLHWSVGRSGDREAERFLRGRLRSGVLSPNSLWGAMAVGGAALAIRLRQRWPGIKLNETHPKALYSWLSGRAYGPDLGRALMWLKERYRVDVTCTNDHEFDALLSALATREALISNWHDLARLCDDHVYPIEFVTYLWPSKEAIE